MSNALEALGEEEDIVAFAHGLVANGLCEVDLAGVAGSGDEHGDLLVEALLKEALFRRSWRI